MLLDFSEPKLDIREGGLVRNIINKDYSRDPFEVFLGDGFESLLAGCIPDRKNDGAVVDLDCFCFEIETCSPDQSVSELIISEAVH